MSADWRERFRKQFCGKYSLGIIIRRDVTVNDIESFIASELASLERERDEARAKLEIHRKENRGTMQGRHEATISRMQAFLENQPLSARPTELQFWEWLERLTKERENLKYQVDMHVRDNKEILKERNRLRAALERIANEEIIKDYSEATAGAIQMQRTAQQALTPPTNKEER